MISEVKEEKKGVFTFRVVWNDADWVTTSDPLQVNNSKDQIKSSEHPTSLDTILSDNTDDKVTHVY